MWPLVLLGAALGSVAYVVTRPVARAPSVAPGTRGYMVTWGRTGSDHWYASLEDVTAEAQRLGDSGVVTRVSGTFVGLVAKTGRVTKG